MGDPGPIPNRWLGCPRKSGNLIAGKFLAFKTPLSNKFDAKVPEECRFPPKMLISSMNNYKVKIGLWIDLTNTNRFYDKADVIESDCKYVKLQCRGHGETPSEDQTRSFIEIVSTFIKNNPLLIVGVHCTHGFNRTGFLIASYMVEQLDCSVEASIVEFAKSRPPGIYKADYLTELFRRYDSVEDAPGPPPLPTWYTESDDGPGELNEQIETNDQVESGSSGTKVKRRKEFVNKNPVFVPGVKGVSHFTTQPRLSELQNKVQKMCGWKKSGFPGSQPVSMDTQNIIKLHEKPYHVSWKADGTRYMMLIEKEGEVFLFDRDYSVFQAHGFLFPKRKQPNLHLVNTLVDGELVIDQDKGRSIPRYLCYDILKIDGKEVGGSAFVPVRLGCIDSEIIKPRSEAIAQGRISRSKEPFEIILKSFWDLTKAGTLLGEKFAKSLLHEPDGLIFQPSQDAYKAGQCDSVLKWKPLNMNSVDFKLKIVKEEGQGILSRKICQLFVGSLERPYGCMKYTKNLIDLDNKIVECKLENGQWIFMRERTDKSYPNSFETAEAVYKSIIKPVTQEKLLEYIQSHRYSDKPPSKKRKQ